MADDGIGSGARRIVLLGKVNRVLAVVAAVVVVVAVAIPSVRALSAGNARAACFGNQAEAAGRGSDFRKEMGDFPNTAAEAYSMPPKASVPSCPGGGEYDWDPTTGTMACSEHGRAGDAP